jgi:hypothetical protein
MKRKRDLFKELFIIFLDVYEVSIFIFYDLSKLLWKYVATVPSVTVAVSPASVDIGQSVTISGVVNSDTDVPAAAGTAVSIIVTDAAGNEQPAINTTTDAKGAYSATFTVPAGFAPGNATVEVTALGTTGTATFTHTQENPAPKKGITNHFKSSVGKTERVNRSDLKKKE